MAPGDLATWVGLLFPRTHAVVRPVGLLGHKAAPFVGDGRFSRFAETRLTAPRGKLEQRPGDSGGAMGEASERLGRSDFGCPANTRALWLLLQQKPLTAKHCGIQQVVAGADPVQNLERNDRTGRTADHIQRFIAFDQRRNVCRQSFRLLNQRCIVPKNRQMCQRVDNASQPRKRTHARDGPAAGPPAIEMPSKQGTSFFGDAFV